MPSSRPHRRRIRTLLSAGVLALLFALATAGPAAAHERREVDRFTFVVGFLAEPAYSHVPNGVDLSISETDTEEPFEDLGDGLAVEVSYGEESMSLSLRPQFGQPGAYRADFVPSRPGTYTFRFQGIVDGIDVDETFTSGPETFNDVQDIAAESWPAQDPTTGQLAERLERELARMDDRIGELEDHDMEAVAATETTPAGGSGDGVARTMGGAALVLALAAVGVATVGRRQ